MKILLDDKPFCPEQLPSDATLTQLIEMAKAEVDGTGSVIVGVRHNDEDVPAERLEEMLPQPVSDFDNLELISGRPKQVVLEALAQVRTAFGETFVSIREAADVLAAGGLADAMTKLAECFGVWAQTHTSVVQGGALVGVDFDSLEIGGRPIVDWLNELSAKLRELKEAIVARDSVLLGDILRYELDETLQQWERMLDGFISHVEQLDEVAPASLQ